jgi:glucokinase
MYLGIDLGGTNIAVGVLDEDAQIVVKTNCKTKVPCTPEELCDSMAATAQEALNKAGITYEDIAWVGVGVPGTIDHETGVVRFSSNLQMKNVDLKTPMEKRTGRKVLIENDANAAAYGEYKAGALRGVRNAVTITLGTGIGSGIILDGKIYSGSNFEGGELGHTVIAFDGRPCSCGRKGCWETYASATGLTVSTREAMLKAVGKSVLWQMAEGKPENVNSRMAFDAMRMGDAVAKAVVDQYIAYLACGLTNCINIFQPDIICIGGGISNEGEYLLEPLREAVEKEVNSMNAEKKTVICRASLGNDAGIIGAALLGE